MRSIIGRWGQEVNFFGENRDEAQSFCPIWYGIGQGVVKALLYVWLKTSAVTVYVRSQFG